MITIVSSSEDFQIPVLAVAACCTSSSPVRGFVWHPLVSRVTFEHNSSPWFGSGGTVSRTRGGTHDWLGHARPRGGGVIMHKLTLLGHPNARTLFKVGSRRGCVPPSSQRSRCWFHVIRGCSSDYHCTEMAWTHWNPDDATCSRVPFLVLSTRCLGSTVRSGRVRSRSRPRPMEAGSSLEAVLSGGVVVPGCPARLGREWGVSVTWASAHYPSAPTAQLCTTSAWVSWHRTCAHSSQSCHSIFSPIGGAHRAA